MCTQTTRWRKDSTLAKACLLFNVKEFFTEQKKALEAVIYGKYVFVNLPTGFGKSLIFQMAPLTPNLRRLFLLS